jgi:hypothetical protein
VLSHTQTVQEPDGEKKVSLCTCGACDNVWWVVCGLEHEPSYCPYCGIKFTSYDGGNRNYGMSGLPTDPEV